MSAEEPQRRLKLGKGQSLFVKRQLQWLPQKNDTWEADFLPLAPSGQALIWLGMVIRHDDDYVLAHQTLQSQPTVNDLAHLLGWAMRRPLVEIAHRPGAIYLRSRPEWEELLPHLKQLGIEVVVQEKLPKWDQAFAQFSAEQGPAKGGRRDRRLRQGPR